MAHPLLAEQNGIAEKDTIEIFTQKQIKQKCIILKQDIISLLLNIYNNLHVSIKSKNLRVLSNPELTR